MRGMGRFGIPTCAAIGYDFAFGWEVAAGFQRTFEESGGQIVQKLWPPQGNADYGPYLAQLKRDQAAYEQSAAQWQGFHRREIDAVRGTESGGRRDRWRPAPR